jgi:hypothetical protein
LTRISESRSDLLVKPMETKTSALNIDPKRWSITAVVTFAHWGNSIPVLAYQSGSNKAWDLHCQHFISSWWCSDTARAFQLLTQSTVNWK